MKISIAIAVLLIAGLTAAIPAPSSVSKIQIRSIGSKDVDLPELVLVVEGTLKDISQGVKSLDSALFTLLEGSPTQAVVQMIIENAETAFQKVFENAMIEALQSSPEELPALINRTIDESYMLMADMLGAIQDAFATEREELVNQMYNINLDFVYAMAQAVQPLYKIIGK